MNKLGDEKKNREKQRKKSRNLSSPRLVPSQSWIELLPPNWLPLTHSRMREVVGQSSLMVLLENVFPLIHSHHLWPPYLNSPITYWRWYHVHELSFGKRRGFGMTTLSFKMSNSSNHRNNNLGFHRTQETDWIVETGSPSSPQAPQTVVESFNHPQGVPSAGSHAWKAITGLPARRSSGGSWFGWRLLVSLLGAVNLVPFVTTKFTGKKFKIISVAASFWNFPNVRF